ncbi:MAG: hypothetical protein ACTHLW_06595, partial [Verrucomicrobiota bacterium]
MNNPSNPRRNLVFQSLISRLDWGARLRLSHSTVLAGSIVTMLLAFVAGSRATDYVSVGNGTWNVPATWSPAGIPTAADNVTIMSGHSITNTTDNSVAGSLTIQSGGGLRMGGTSNPRSITLAGNFTNNGTLSGYTGGTATFITNSANAVWVGSGDTSGGKIAIVVNAGSTLDISGLTTPLKYRSAGGCPNQVNGTLITGTQVIDANGNSGCSFTIKPGGTLVSANPNGLVNGTLGTFNFNAGNVTLSNSVNYTFNGIDPQITAGLPDTVNNLTIDN